MIRHFSILLLTILSISVSPLNAAEPLLTIGKPYLDESPIHPMAVFWQRCPFHIGLNC